MSGVIDVTTSLGDLVTSHPQLARELERCGLDYCCGGHRTLAAACAADRPDLDAMTTIDELRAVLEATNGEPPAWAAMDVAELTEHIETTHHRHLRSELPRLSELLAKVTGVHGHRHPELHAIQARFAELRAELEPHLATEEAAVFPAIRRLAGVQRDGAPKRSPLDMPISALLVEHYRAGQLLATLRRLTDGYRPPADGCASYRTCYAALAELEADIHLHVHKENNVLFPAVIALEGGGRAEVRS